LDVLQPVVPAPIGELARPAGHERVMVVFSEFRRGDVSISSGCVVYGKPEVPIVSG
jgi:hypothetical protein